MYVFRLIMKYASSLRQIHFLYSHLMDLIQPFKRILYVTYIHPSKLNIKVNIFSVKIKLVKYILSYHDKHLVDNDFSFIQNTNIYLAYYVFLSVTQSC